MTSSNVVTAMLKVFSIDVYVLFDPSANLSFVTLLVDKNFYILPEILHEPFIVFTLVGESVVAKRVYKNCPIMFPNRVSHIELVEFDMLDSDVIFCMDWFHACFASIDYRTRVVKFIFQLNPLYSGRQKILFLEVVSSLV